LGTKRRWHWSAQTKENFSETFVKANGRSL
jgi:hypothetical protein